MRKKLSKVVVSFKWSEMSKPNVISVIFANVAFEGFDLKGKTKWSDTSFSRRAVELYETSKGRTDIVVKDVVVDRVYCS